ncbi:hypothetical protein HK098_004875, partial [Nowakowskiella sp. JEL0407]
MKISCKLLDGSPFDVEVESTDKISELKKKIKKEKEPKLYHLAADELLLVRVFERGKPTAGVKDSTRTEDVLKSIANGVIAAESPEETDYEGTETPGTPELLKLPGWQFEDERVAISAKVMNPGGACSDYCLNRDSAKFSVDVLVIIPAEREKPSTSKEAPGTAMLRTREQIIQIEKATSDLNGINVFLPHLERKNILEKICSFFDEMGRRFLLLNSPAGSGKTSILNLLESGKTKYQCYYLSCARYRNLADVLYSELKSRSNYFIQLSSTETFFPTNVDIIIMLDDAQKTYSDQDGWAYFLKNGDKFIPGNVKFLIAATHMLKAGEESPWDFQTLPKIARDDLLLSEAESAEFLDSPLGMKDRFDFPSVRSILIRQSAGLVGALRVSVLTLASAFSKNDSPTEDQVLQFVLSNNFVAGMTRVFGSEHTSPLEPGFITFLEELFTGEAQVAPIHLTGEDDKLFIRLQKSGILIDRDGLIDFTSSLARRYFIKWLFPQRASKDPTSLRILVEKCIRSMSASLLLMSTVPGAKFSKEATFQHLTMRGLAENTTPNCAICPELSKIYPDSNVPGGSIKGEIDFYLNGKLLWGIELLVNGSGIGEHLQRFSKKGKYEPLKVKDYVVVDFRENDTGEPTNIISELKKKIKKEKEPKLYHLAADKLLLVRVFERGKPTAGVKDSTRTEDVLKSIANGVIAAESPERTDYEGTETPGTPELLKLPGWQFEDERVAISAKVMNPGGACSDYCLNRDSAKFSVDVLVIIPAEREKPSTSKEAPGTAMLRTREQIIQIEKATSDLNGINVFLPHLERKNILEKICSFFDEMGRRFLLLNSPAGSGKTSILNLLESGKTKYQCYYLSCARYRNLADVLYSELKSRSNYFIQLSSTETFFPTNVDIIIMLDDAQKTYSDQDGWAYFLKNGDKFIPGNVKFLIAATHMLKAGEESPGDFQTLPKIARDDLLLSEAESAEFLDSPLGMKDRFDFPSVRSILIRQSAGLVGALRVSVLTLASAFSKNDSPTEDQVLQSVLSNNFVAGMTRVFGSEHTSPLEPGFITFLEELFTGEAQLAPIHLTGEDDKLFIRLQKSGILIDRDGLIDFTSSLARRYFIKWLFPQRASKDPTSLRILVEKCIRSMSASLLLNSTVPDAKFSKEATFQHLAMRGLAGNTSPSCAICPELSKIYPDSSTPGGSIKGEIDFYLNGNLRWGIELLVNGSGIGEHLQRFSKKGKYEPLKVKDYLVVDFRENDTGEPTNI